MFIQKSALRVRRVRDTRAQEILDLPHTDAHSAIMVSMNSESLNHNKCTYLFSYLESYRRIHPLSACTDHEEDEIFLHAILHKLKHLLTLRIRTEVVGYQHQDNL